MFEKIHENTVTFLAPKIIDKVSRELTVFYNPIMKLNRDLSVLLLNSINRKDLLLADPMGGTGIRMLRFLTEVNEEVIATLAINDHDSDAVSLIDKNSAQLPDDLRKKLTITQKDANLFLLESKGFDYIDIDPFGSPNPFLDAAIKRISRKGILAVTATDTAALSGTYPQSCIRKYDAKPLRGPLQHEIGLRILIRKVQTIGAMYDKALVPILSLSKDHYMRVFFECKKGKTKVDELHHHNYFVFCNKCTNFFVSKYNNHTCCDTPMEFAGQLYVGQLYSQERLTAMIEKTLDEPLRQLLTLMLNESKSDQVGFYDIHHIAKKHQTGFVPKFDQLFDELNKKGYNASRTHVSLYGIKTTCPFNSLVEIIKELKNKN